MSTQNHGVMSYSPIAYSSKSHKLGGPKLWSFCKLGLEASKYYKNVIPNPSKECYFLLFLGKLMG